MGAPTSARHEFASVAVHDGARPAPPVVQRKCSGCAREDDEGTHVQRRAKDPAAPDADSGSIEPVLRSSGQPLDAQTRAVMERHLGYDFAQVRVHADGPAAESARAMNATAYTVGRDVVFDAGAYAPHSTAGRRLIAHELTHVIQQARGPVEGRMTAGGLRVSDPDDAHERQADAAAAGLRSDVAAGPAAAGANLTSLATGATPAVQRKARRGGATRAAARVPTIVEDGAPVVAGQMNRTAFLSALHAAVSAGVDTEFRRIGRPGRDCPYILRTIERYRGLPVSALMRLVAVFARPAPGTSAHGLIDAVAARASLVARRIASRESPRAQAAMEGGHPALPSHEPAVIRSQLGAGRALDHRTRDRMERSYGTSFAAVRVHDDATAGRFNSALGARAFTIGSDIAFAAGQYRPGTPPGDRLIAHELAHTIQQGGSATAGAGGPVQDLERQAEDAAVAAVDRDERSVAARVAPARGTGIQRAPVVVAGALIVAEATPEIIVVAEVASVTTAEVVVADGALVVAADVAAPALLEVAAPAAVETLAPAAIETVAPAVASSSVYTTAATVATVGAVSTMSSDSPQSQDPDPRRRCQETNPSALQCDGFGVGIEEAAIDFLTSRGYDFDALGHCEGETSFGSGVIDACSGAPGQSWHCDVRGSDVPLSIFGCLCCEADGSTSYEWLGAHWSRNLSRRGGR